MLDRLPVVINPLSFAERGKRLSGALKISELTRLSDLLLENTGVVDIDISFDKEGRLAVIYGEIKVNLMLQCQSCLDQLDLVIETSFKLGVVSSLQEAEKLTGECEPLILENEKISLAELIEDEVLLALPDFPRHEDICTEKIEDSKETIKQREQINPNNPFAVLAKLKNTGD